MSTYVQIIASDNHRFDCMSSSKGFTLCRVLLSTLRHKVFGDRGLTKEEAIPRVLCRGYYAFKSKYPHNYMLNAGRELGISRKPDRLSSVTYKNCAYRHINVLIYCIELIFRISPLYSKLIGRYLLICYSTVIVYIQ